MCHELITREKVDDPSKQRVRLAIPRALHFDVERNQRQTTSLMCLEIHCPVQCTLNQLIIQGDGLLFERARW